MPAFAPFFTDGGVLRATHWSHSVVARSADIAAYALADIINATIADFGWQERIGNRWPRRTDHIENAFPDGADHCVGEV